MTHETNMARVDIVILNWNGLRFLQPCLDALAEQTFRDYQIWLVDNGSTDGSVAFVRANYPHVHLITNATNRGFAAANNQAIRAGHAEFVATLNNDTMAKRDWLAHLVAALERNPTAGSAASKMLIADRRTIIDSAGIAIDRVGIAWDRYGGQPTNAADEPQFIFGACAGAALYRRAMLQEIGLFDEEYFAYLEDVDLAWRAQWAGWRSIYVPTACVYHHHSATGGEGSPFKNRLLGRNKVWLIAQNYPAPYLAGFLPVIMLYDFASVAYALMTHKDVSPLQGRLAGILGLLQGVPKRRSATRQISNKEMMRLLAPVEWPWRVLNRYRHLTQKTS